MITQDDIDNDRYYKIVNQVQDLLNESGLHEPERMYVLALALVERGVAPPIARKALKETISFMLDALDKYDQAKKTDGMTKQ